MGDIRQNVYGLMRKELSQQLSIQRESDNQGEIDAFNLIYKRTKFGRCVRTMETENRAMRAAGIKVSRFEFDPRDAAGELYNVSIEFAANRSEQHDHGGQRGHH